MKTCLPWILLALGAATALNEGLLAATVDSAAAVASPAVPDPLAPQAAAEAFREGLAAADRDLSEKMRETFRALDSSLRAVRAKAEALGNDANVLTALRALVRELRAQGQAVLEAQRSFVGSASNFAERLSEGPDRFRALAGEFRAYAKEETYSELAEDYVRSGAMFEALAQRCEDHLRRVEPSIAEYRANLGYIERSLLFLDRLDKALETVPDLAQFDRLESSVQQLSRYVHGFERLRGSLKEFDERLHAPADEPAAAPSASPTAAHRSAFLH